METQSQKQQKKKSIVIIMPASYIKVLALFLLLACLILIRVTMCMMNNRVQRIQSNSHTLFLSSAHTHISHRVRSETIERSTCSAKVYYTWCICFETIYLSHVEQLYVSSTHNSIMIPLATVLTLTRKHTHTCCVQNNNTKNKLRCRFCCIQSKSSPHTVRRRSYDSLCVATE